MLETEGNESRKLRTEPISSERLQTQRRVQHSKTKQQNALFQLRAQEILTKAKVQNIVRTFGDRLMKNAFLLPSSKIGQPYFREKYIYDKYEQNGNEYLYSGYSLNILQNLPIWLPTDNFILCWDLLTILISFLSLWLYPFTVSFLYQHITYEYRVLQYIVMSQICLDFLLQFNMAIIHQGYIVKQRDLIFYYYFQKQGLFDLGLCILWITQTLQIDYISGLKEVLTILVTVVNVKRVLFKLDMHWDQIYCKGHLPNLLELLKLITLVFFFAHMMACIFHYIADRTQDSLGDSWIIQQKLVNSDTWMKYMVAFYWASMTITTIGYGDVTGVNYVELIFCSIAMFCSACVFGYVVSTIVTILNQINEEQHKYKQQLTAINQYMSEHNVSVQIQSRVRNYLKYYRDSSHGEGQQEINQLVQILPLELQQDLNSEVKMKIIQKIPQFQKFSAIVRKQLAQILQFSQYTPKEQIFSQNQDGLISLYYVLQGEVNLIERNSNYQLQVLKTGDVLGQYQFFTGEQPPQTAISEGFTNICRFELDKFLEILNQNHLDMQLYKSIRDKIIFGSHLDEINLQCNLCQQTDHLNINCPWISYRPDLELKNKRDDLIRSNRHLYHLRRQFKYQSLKDIKITQQAHREYRKNQEHLDEIIQTDIQSDNSITIEKDNSISPDPIPQMIIKEEKRASRLAIPTIKQIIEVGQSIYNIIPKEQEHINMSIDDLHSYVHYYPEFNIDTIMISLSFRQQLIRFLMKNRVFIQSKKYFSNFKQMITIIKMKRLLN